METTKERTTVVTKRQSMGTQPHVQPKYIQVHRRSHVAGGGTALGGHSMSSMSQSMGFQGGRASLGMSAGVAGGIATKDVGTMKVKREGEKKDMQHLNDRLADYITKVRSLQLENDQLREKLSKKRREFDVDPLKETYQAEIDEAKNLLLAANKENGELKINITSYEEEIEDLHATARINDERVDQLQDKVNQLIDENSHREAECNMLHKKVDQLEKQVAHWRAKYNEVNTQLQATRADLKDETQQRIFLQQKIGNVEEELEFLRSVTDAEIKEYRAMLTKEDDTGTNVSAAWNNEMANCMKELREEYDQRLADISDELNARYESQLSQIRESVHSEPVASVQSKSEKTTGMMSVQKDMRIKELEGMLERMKVEMVNLTNKLQRAEEDLENEKELRTSDVKALRLEMESMLNELQMLMDAKLSLELEIAAYRKLLEGEEHRISTGYIAESLGGFRSEGGDMLANILERGGGGGGGGGGGSGFGSGSGMAGGDSGRLTIQRSSKSVISFGEVESSGQYVTLENTSSGRSKTSVNMKGWKLDRVIAATSISPEVTIHFDFADSTVLDGDQSIKIWGKNYKKMAKPGDIVANVDEWGPVNRNSVFSLFDEKDGLKANLSTKVVT